jgi:hypothetical protein
MRSIQHSSLAVTFVLLAGCATLPDGPSVLVLPGTAKSYDQFRNDDYVCRQTVQTLLKGGTPQQAAMQSGIASAAVGTLVGAAAGAAIGGGQGAAVGSGLGLAVGSMAGAGAASGVGQDAQQRYDSQYIQCMYAKGHRVPVWTRFIETGDRAAPSKPIALPPPPNQPPPAPNIQPPPPPTQ